MISFEEARQLLRQSLPPGRKVIRALQDTLLSFSAEDIPAIMDVPSFDNSAMDGYAFCYEVGVNRLHPEGEVRTGAAPSFRLAAGQCARIYTGAMMPSGADTVVPFEKVITEGEWIRFNPEEIRKGANVRLSGTQHRKGDIILQAGTCLWPGTIGLLASNGYAEATVFDKPSVALIITGDELVEPGHSLSPGQIYNSNAPALCACLDRAGIDKRQVFHVADQEDRLSELLESVLDAYDAVILTGGISAGDYDFVKKVLPLMGVQTLFYKVRQKPGKPLYAGLWKGKPVFGLPGNPASVLTCFSQFVLPALRQMSGDPRAYEPALRQVLLNTWTKKDALTHVLKAKSTPDGVLILPGQESFNLSAFASANALLVMPGHIMQWDAGEMVEVYLW